MPCQNKNYCFYKQPDGDCHSQIDCDYFAELKPGGSELHKLLGGSVRYKLTGADFDLEFSAPRASTRKELGVILAELADGLQADPIPHPDLF